MKREVGLTKKCARCGVEFPRTGEHFYLRPDGNVSAYCKPCQVIKSGVFAREWPKKNREKSRAATKRHSDNHPEWAREKSKRYRERHPELVKMRSDIYRLKQIGGFEAQYQQQDGKCGYCGCNLNGAYEVDHIHPLIKGGTNDPSNLMVCCSPCNDQKGSRSLAEWTPPLQRKITQ